ncbi:unnamed protein product [Adineta ricciae]|uniref:Tectonic-like protein n=1 Tax=Adineta ricciae TaxID=249248 RepID=A0A813VA23_ADIRI|nr:unnamed protein product [Adineta ricciae]
MAEEALANFGLFIDSENRIRLIDPERITDSNQLRDDCKDFTENVFEFKKLVDTLIERTEEYSKQVEAVRLKAIGAKNLMKSAAKHRKFEKQQLQSLIKEKMIELDRLRVEYESLQKIDHGQSEQMIFFSVLLLFTVVNSQDVSVTFPTFPANTDIGSCTCDLTGNACDTSCCCDPDCTSNDLLAFGCDSQANQYTNTTPIYSTVQSTCFKNLSIFYTNTPYVIQKMGELVCIDYARYSGSQYYQQPNIQTLNAADFIRTLDTQYSVTAQPTISTSLTNYQVGTSVLAYTSATGVSIYTLPIGLFGNSLCSGSQTISMLNLLDLNNANLRFLFFLFNKAYMNDFTSTCNQQLVDQTTCTGALNPLTYISPLCLLRSPANLTDSSARVCSTAIGSNPTYSTGSCTNALQSLTVTIYYTNPTGIVNVVVSSTTGNASSSTPFTQTFTVNFVQNGSSVSSTTSNPGYLPGAVLASSTINGTSITVLRSSQFSVIQAGSNGFCDSSLRTPIRFGENIQSTCQLSSTCPNSFDLFPATGSLDLYVAAYSDSDTNNVTSDWLPVIYYTSQLGSPNIRLFGKGILNSTSSGSCYSRLDIQIAYTNIGYLSNPQSVLSAVIFHYQYSSSNSTVQFVTQSVTFQDISASPTVIQGQVPAPNTRLPANFFYPFSVSKATRLNICASFSLLAFVAVCALVYKDS